MIKVKNLYKSFDTNEVLKGISFEIQKGEIVGLLGPNGAGKTTTMRILTGFLELNKGTVEIDGRDVMNSKDLVEIKRRIGYLPENNPLYPEMFVREYLNMMGEFKSIPKGKREKEVRKAVEEAGIESVYYKPISQLSKGYKQRVGLAASILGNPEILILDEPTEGLDPNQRVDIRNLIKKLGKDKTVVVSSHVLSEIESTCSRVIIIDEGRVVEDGNTGEVISGAKGVRQVTVEIEGADVSLKHINTKALKYLDSGVEGRVRLMLEVEGNEDIRPKIFEMCKEKGWVLYEMFEKGKSLEDAFREVTSQELEIEDK